MKNFTNFLIDFYDEDEEELSPLEEAKLRVLIGEDAWEKRQKDRNALARQLSARFGNQDKQIQQPKRPMANVKPKDNVKDVMQGALDDVVSPMRGKTAQAKQRAKNLGFQVTPQKVMEPQFDMDSEEDRPGQKPRERVKLDLDYDVNLIKDRQANRVVSAPEATGESGKVNQAPTTSKNKKTGRGGGVPGQLNENAVLELVMQRIENGVEPTSDVGEAIAKEYHDDDGKIDSASKSAKVLLDFIGEDVKPGEYLYGKKGGQHTGIPDEFRTNIGDDIFELFVEGMGSLFGDKAPTSRQAKRGGEPTAKDISDRDVQRRQQVQNYFFGGGSPSGLEDGFQTADIFMVRKAMQEELMGELQQHVANFGSSLFGSPTSMDGEMLANAFRNTLMKYQKNKDLLPVSLKQIAKNKPAKLHQYNTGFDDLQEVINVDFDRDPTARLSMGDLPGDSPLGRLGSGKEIQTPSGGKAKPQARYEDNIIGLQGARNIDASGMMDVVNSLTGEQGTFPLKFFAGNKRWDGYKVEPSSTAAKLGEYNMGEFRNLFNKLELDDLDHMIPRMKITGDRLSDVYDADKQEFKPEALEMVQNSEQFSPEMIDYWANFAKNYQDKAPDDLKFSDDEFSYRGEQYSPDEFMRKVLGDSVISDEERGNLLVDRDGAKFHQLESRSWINGMLRNLRVMDLLREAQSRDDNGIKKLIGNMIYGSARINSSNEDEFWPRLQISS